MFIDWIYVQNKKPNANQYVLVLLHTKGIYGDKIHPWDPKIAIGRWDDDYDSFVDANGYDLESHYWHPLPITKIEKSNS